MSPGAPVSRWIRSSNRPDKALHERERIDDCGWLVLGHQLGMVNIVIGYTHIGRYRRHSDPLQYDVRPSWARIDERAARSRQGSQIMEGGYTSAEVPVESRYISLLTRSICDARLTRVNLPHSVVREGHKGVRTPTLMSDDDSAGGTFT